MAELISLKHRIKSAGNVAKITKAMEMVSAAKMKKAQAKALASRVFAQKLDDIIGNLAQSDFQQHHPLFQQSSSPHNIALLIFSTNKGLCGSLNANLYKAIFSWLSQKGKQYHYHFIIVGKKLSPHFPNYKSELLARFTNLSDHPTFQEVRAIAKLFINEFQQGIFDEVYAFYPHFISTLQNEIRIKKILPFAPHPQSLSYPHTSIYTLEPNPQKILDKLLLYQLEMAIYQITLETKASEHSARMVAMKNASENANELINNLTLQYNQARQTKVTNEILDATSARLALKE